MENFASYFRQLTGISGEPFPWQAKLFERLKSGDVPRVVTLPTGMGKTSVMTVWLLALAEAPDAVPRRLIWVVNRRVVVDQATDEARNLAQRVEQIPELRQSLAALSIIGASQGVLGVSTLRGQLADNREWSRDPSRPAIAVGTVDIIGSRLLFSGYGDGPWYRPYHAGLLGQDALLVNDEAHLTPAFSTLIDTVAAWTTNSPGIKPVRSLKLSATLAGSDRWPESLDEDKEQPEFRKRFSAHKRLRLHTCADRARMHKKMVELAAADGAGRTLVFVQSPEDAAAIRTQIAKAVKSELVELLTGTLRGYERDRLAEGPVFQAFQQKTPPEQRCWLVATSAGEAGVNISADRLISDLDTADHLLQRFGRLNRFGETSGEAHVVHLEKPPKEPERLATLEYLRSLQDDTGSADVCPEALSSQPAPKEAWPPEPLTPRLEGWLLDIWSQTSLGQHAARPPVAPWLHGRQDGEPPQTELAWRWDAAELAKDGVSAEDRQEVLRRFPVLAHERLRDSTTRIKDKLANLPPGLQCLKVGRDGRVEAVTTGDAGDIEYCLLVLPVAAGSLVNGMFSPETADGGVRDVAEHTGDDRRRTRSHEPLDGNEWTEAWRVEIEPPEDAEDDVEPVTLYYWTARRKKGPDLDEVDLERHLKGVSRTAGDLGRRLGLASEIVAAMELAGLLHDQGKADPIWQRAMNGNIEKPLAKTKGGGRPGLLDGFRHEFKSVAMAGAAEDLALHLVAAHHGWSRPHFPLRAFDRRALKSSEQLSLECARRFSRLTRRYGHWGLAYLEALFKAADGLASQEEQEMREQPEYA